MLNGRELSKRELEVIRRHLESLDTISGISDEVHNLIAQLWPDQLVKIKPPKELANQGGLSRMTFL